MNFTLRTVRLFVRCVASGPLRIHRIVVAALLAGLRRAALHCGHNIARLLRGLRALWCVEDHCCPARVLDLQKKTHILFYQPCCGVCLPHAPSGPLARFLRPGVRRLHTERERSLAEKREHI